MQLGEKNKLCKPVLFHFGENVVGGISSPFQIWLQHTHTQQRPSHHQHFGLKRKKVYSTSLSNCRKRNGRSLKREGGATHKGPLLNQQQALVSYPTHPTSPRKERKESPVGFGEGLFIRVGEPVRPSVLPKWRTPSHHAHARSPAQLFFSISTS